MVSVGSAGLIASAGLVSFQYVITFAPSGRYVVLGAFLVLLFFSATLRITSGTWLRNHPTRVLIYGDEKTRGLIENELLKKPYICRIVGMIPLNGKEQNQGLGNPSLENGDLLSLCIEAELVVSHTRFESRDARILLKLAEWGLPIVGLYQFFEEAFDKLPAEIVDTEYVMAAQSPYTRPFGRLIKRASDVCFSMIGLLVTMPMWPFIALAIKITSKGPVFFRQHRLGRGGIPFSMMKFRTMVDNAELCRGPQWCSKLDARITPVGRFLRKTRLDETPQFLNVLVGQMSMVGPRPERPEFSDSLSEQFPGYLLRYMVKPGITGWAQIKFRYGASYADTLEKLRYDFYYIKNASLILDIYIVIRTVGALMKGSR